MELRYLEDLAVGETAESSHVVTDADIRAFADVTGDHNPLHLDEAFAATTRFKGRIAHGMLAGGYISALLANKLPGPGAIYVSQTMSFRRPVRIGDEVTTRGVIEAIDLDKGLATVATSCLVRGKVVVDGQAVIMPARRAAA